MNKHKQILRYLLLGTEVFILAAIISLVILNSVFSIVQIDGNSMSPNLENRDVVLMRTWNHRKAGSKYKHGDIVIFRQSGLTLAKRIIAIGGDTIKINDNHVLLNNELLEESYLSPSVRTKINTHAAFGPTLNENEDLLIPKGKYFVMGDNRENSSDSRYSEIGLVDETQIAGKIVMQVLPFGQLHLIDNK